MAQFAWDSPEMKVLIKGQIRRAFKLSPQFREVMFRARREFPPLLKKDGTPGKRPVVKYQCEECGNLFAQKNIQIDHIEPAIALDRHEVDYTYDELVKGICCDITNLQALCSTKKEENGGVLSCHTSKTNREKFFRRAIQDLKDTNKFISLDEDLLYKLSLEYDLYLIEKEKEAMLKAERKLKRNKKKGI